MNNGRKITPLCMRASQEVFTRSKIGTKKAALETAESDFAELTQAEQFLVQYCASKSKCKIFDKLRHEEYHKQAFKFDLDNFPPTSCKACILSVLSLA